MLKNSRRLSFLCLAAQRVSLRTEVQRQMLKIPGPAWVAQVRGKKDESSSNLSALFKPVPVKSNPDDINIGAELTGNLDKAELLKVLNKFSQKREIKMLCTENGLDIYLQQQAFASFRRYCMDADNLPADLHITVSDILQGAGHVDDLFPYFLRHAKQIFPHLDCMDDLRKISDLRTPANWYPNARAITRKIIFHSGPTNSGKTYHAMERFLTAKSGVYCGPLKLLATEVFHKSNERGTSCDLITGEERKFARGDGSPSVHVSCTVEMTSVTHPYEVAVIDEIQLLRDPQRGWAWTRAFLGLIAEEIHVCGEAGCADLLQQICATTGESLEIRHYKRLTELSVEDRALGTLENVLPGDCIVCFSKNDIYAVSREIEARGKEVAVIYGGLPPGTKLAQAAKFNDINNSCKVMVATDAIGMGLNLSIRRIIFYSLIKPTMNEKGEKEMDTISVSAALQIAGRAGRYGTQWEEGFVTTYKAEDLSTLKTLLRSIPEPLTQAGLHPTADQIELYQYHLPNSTLSNLMDIFVSLSTVDDSLYFMCNTEDFKFLAEMIQHVPLPLRARYVFCCAPINRRMPFVCSMFLKFARQYSRNDPMTFDWLMNHCGWPFVMPRTILDLVHLEAVFDVMDLYLWFSYRFMDLFPDSRAVRDAQKELDDIIQQGVFQITKLLKNSETATSNNTPDEDSFELNQKRNHYLRGPRSGGAIRGRLTERLLAQGLLTPAMLQELKREWNEGPTKQSDASDDDDDPKPKSRFRKRKFK
ncbi:ATP-dependent RNA helicase SUV3 homolog, mitochondrial [Phlebotomus argentipes]|uniref:ATP-dependent RNA helicase SUV3 homolog, mitochondrial n=1 Tax=Phlebotomus argentipes TaxID=94469 RepID=UPI002892B5F1|nr:ATP-dependent RNA helicase SUV3 homolog, mitochondrial [Phlebotomus argentipes]